MKHLFNLLLLLIVTAFSAMAYHTNTDLANASDERLIVQSVDDERTNLATIKAVEEAAADDQHDHYEAAQKMLSIIESKRADSDELINTYMRGSHQVPLDPVPPYITDISVDLTKHKIFKRRMGADMDKNYRLLESDAISKLEKIQRGTIKISESPDVGASHFRTNKKKSDKVWTDDLLDRY